MADAILCGLLTRPPPNGAATLKHHRPDIQHVNKLLGSEIGRVRLVDHEVRSRSIGAGWITEDLLFHSNIGDQIPAWFVHPTNVEAPAPAILYCHAHGNRYDIGRTEVVEGRPALQAAYAPDLQELGWAILCLEMPCFGERREHEESALSKSHLWQGRTLFGRILAELVAGVDFLAAHPAINSERIAAMGISMGGTHAWWLAALEPRIKAAVHMCCFSDMECLIASGAHDGHGHYMTVPGLLACTSTGRLAGLAAPRPQLCCVGMKDWSTPADCFVKARSELEEAYEEAGHAEALEFFVEPDAGHEETPAMRKRVLDFLARHL
ncbi:MAG: alpha/beta hydrolase [Alphaproteobacteria bacterium]